MRFFLLLLVALSFVNSAASEVIRLPNDAVERTYRFRGKQKLVCLKTGATLELKIARAKGRRNLRVLRMTPEKFLTRMQQLTAMRGLQRKSEKRAVRRVNRATEDCASRLRSAATPTPSPDFSPSSSPRAPIPSLKPKPSSSPVARPSSQPPASSSPIPSASSSPSPSSSPAASPSPADPTWRSSITQRDITWTFDRAYPTGQFANGDWWVVGPVTVMSVSPEPNDGHNGSMLNPRTGLGQALDRRANHFEESLLVEFPASLVAGDALVSSKSLFHGQHDCGPELIRLFSSGRCSRSTHYKVEAAEVLTVLSDPVSEEFLRPPFMGTDRRMKRVSDIRFDYLPSLPISDPAPDTDRVLKNFSYPWILFGQDWSARGIHPVENMPGYHRETSNHLGLAIAAITLDLPEPRRSEIVIRMVQTGLDAYAMATDGYGDSMSVRPLVVLAGYLLQDQEIANAYIEDRVVTPSREQWQTYHIVNDKLSPHISSVIAEGQTFTGYGPWAWRKDPGSKEHMHLDPATEWHLPSDGGGSKQETYRNAKSASWVCPAAALNLLGLRSSFAHDAYFEYVKAWTLETNGKAYFEFCEGYWEAYGY